MSRPGKDARQTWTQDARVGPGWGILENEQKKNTLSDLHEQTLANAPMCERNLGIDRERRNLVS